MALAHGQQRSWWPCAISFLFLFVFAFLPVESAFPVTLNATKINSAGTYAAGSAVPTWLGVANVVGAFAGKWNPYIFVGGTIAAAVLSDYQSPPGQLKLWPSKDAMKLGVNKPVGWVDGDTPPQTSPPELSYTYSDGGRFGISCYNGSLSCAGAAACVRCCGSDVACAGATLSSTSTTSGGMYATANCNLPPAFGGGPFMCGIGTSNPVNKCPAGYVLSGSNCVLSETPNSNPPVVAQWPDYMNDGPPDGYLDAAGIWRPNPRNKVNDGLCFSACDGSKPVAPFAQTFGTSNPIFRSGYDSQGNVSTQTVTPNSSGGFSIEQQIQGNGIPLADGTTPKNAVEKQGFSVDKMGNINNYWYQTTNNSTINTITGEQDVKSTPIDTSGLATAANQQSQIDLQTSANTKLDDIKTKLTPEPVTIPETSLRASILADMNTIKGNIENPTNANAPILNIAPIMDFAMGTCYPKSWDFGDLGVVSLSRFCIIYDDIIRPMLNWLIGVWTVWYLWNFWWATVREI